MSSRTLPWITGGSHCEIHWLFEENKWDPKPYFDGHQYPGTQVRLERIVRLFAASGRLPRDKGHWRAGPSPCNKIYEFKDVISGLRLLAFSFTQPSGVCWFIVALGVTKDRGDITPEEVDRAIQRRQRFLDANHPKGMPESQIKPTGTQPRKRR